MNTYSFRKDLISVQEELLRFAYKLTADKEEANDLLQETSLKALDNEDKYMPDTNFKGWMYTIMRNIFNPLAELNKRIFKSANRFVVNVVYILK
ncbi:sigma factor, partial [Bacteroides cellulosilyticus]|uniref:sigma factor n=1 Tax=Bacteroides cellulosilyticus TaxID=246787 RepID=UPI002938F82A